MRYSLTSSLSLIHIYLSELQVVKRPLEHLFTFEEGTVVWVSVAVNVLLRSVHYYAAVVVAVLARLGNYAVSRF